MMVSASLRTPLLFIARALVVAVALFLTAVASTYAQAPSVEEVAATLEEAAALVAEGDTAGARMLLASLESVSLDKGGEMALQPEPWLRLLDDAPGEAAERLRAAASALREPDAALPDDARSQLETVLARPEFRPVQPTLWERVSTWLWETFVRILGRILNLSGADVAGNLSAWILALASGAIVVGVLVFFLRGLRRSVVEGEAFEQVLGEVPRYAGEAQHLAAEAAGAGNFREAMRLLYLAALLHLDEVGMLRFDRALTNREVLASVAADAPLRRQLAPVVAQFDRVWYGHAPFGQAEFEAVEQQIRDLRAMERGS
jgi:hypothetical protein